MLNIEKNTFLNESEIREQAKSIFTAKGAPGTSEKYAHISTFQIIQDMEKLGWGVVDAKQVRARKGDGYQKHLVVFRNNDIVINGEDGDHAYPQILLTNSTTVDGFGFPSQGSRDIQWGWNPVGGARGFDAALTPNYLLLGAQIGTVTIQIGA